MPNDTRIIEVFKPGTFKPMAGEPIEFTADMLREVAAAYDPAVSEAPSVVGHPRTDDPAYGWAKRFFYDDKAGVLRAEVGDLDPAFSDAVAKKRYRKISLAFFHPNAPANPKPGTYYPRHIGFLGAQAPAVPGLKPVAFAGTDDDIVEFSAWAERSVAGLFRSLRDFLIAQFGQEEADKALPDYQVSYLADQAVREEVEENGPRPAFAAPPQPEASMPNPNTVPAAAPATAPAADDRERALAERERQIAERERQIAHDANVAFADSIIGEGRFLPAHRDRLVNVLDASDAGGDTVSFADGGTRPVAEELRTLLKELPQVVPFGGPVKPGAVDSGPEFAAPDGMTASSERLDLHHQALAYQRQNPKNSYAEAVKAVEAGA